MMWPLNWRLAVRPHCVRQIIDCFHIIIGSSHFGQFPAHFSRTRLTPPADTQIGHGFLLVELVCLHWFMSKNTTDSGSVTIPSAFAISLATFNMCSSDMLNILHRNEMLMLLLCSIVRAGFYWPCPTTACAHNRTLLSHFPDCVCIKCVHRNATSQPDVCACYVHIHDFVFMVLFYDPQFCANCWQQCWLLSAIGPKCEIRNKESFRGSVVNLWRSFGHIFVCVHQLFYNTHNVWA